MAIRVVKLKSGEDLVADVSEVQHKDTGVRQAFIFNNAYPRHQLKDISMLHIKFINLFSFDEIFIT